MAAVRSIGPGRRVGRLTGRAGEEQAMTHPLEHTNGTNR